MAAPQAQAPDPLRAADLHRLVVVAPNWLGDAVMALPALADVRRASPSATITVAARAGVAPLFTMVPGVDAVVTLDARGRGWRDESAALRAQSFDVALLFPNSFHSALIAARAGIRARWGYAGQYRRPLLTRDVARPRDLHQAAFYQHLTQALGFAAGALEPRLEVTAAALENARGTLRASGWDGRAPLVALAAGAAYGAAKRWPGASFAAAARTLAGDGIVPVLIGSGADVDAGSEVIAALGGARVVNLIGRTDLPALAAVLATVRSIVTNDSGAMHLAAALGVPVTAIFGPTDETATHPLGRAPVAILTHHVWCRPCLLRECPLTHACMRGVAPGAVANAARVQVADHARANAHARPEPRAAGECREPIGR